MNRLISLRGPRTTALVVVILAFITTICEGFDLVVYGALIPDLVREPGWGLGLSGAGTIGSLAYTGMLIGALCGGPLTDRFGRRRLLLVAVATFTVFTAASALAAAPWHLGLCRLLVGIGAGGAAPATIALIKEFCPDRRVGLAVSFALAGIPGGALIASYLAIPLLPEFGWRSLLALGAGVSFVILVALVAVLPETPHFIQSRTRGDTSRRSRPRQLLSQSYKTVTLLLFLSSFTAMLLFYGLNTWLITLMTQLGYPTASALEFSVTMNLGSVLSVFAMGPLADRIGIRLTALLAIVIASMGSVAVTVGIPNQNLLLFVIGLIGFGTQATMSLIITAVAQSYPAGLRASAVGWTNGVGRLGAILAPSLGGWMLAAELGPRSLFIAFTTSGIASAAALAALTHLDRRRSSGSPTKPDAANTGPGESGTYRSEGGM
jgi:AAHS family benzoate transporter-like MFS transporter